MRPIDLHRASCVYVLASLMGGCAAEGGGSTPSDVIEASADQTSVGTFIALLTVRIVEPVEKELQPYDGYYVDSSHIESLALRVDGAEWGIFTVEPQVTSATADAEVNGWGLTADASSALVVAEIGGPSHVTDQLLETAGDWAALLGKRVLPGGHAAQVEKVTLRSAADGETILQPQTWLPFDVTSGDDSVYLGEILVEVDQLGPIGGAP